MLHSGEHGAMFGGNPLACTLARAALEVLDEERTIRMPSGSGAAPRKAHIVLTFCPLDLHLARLRPLGSVIGVSGVDL